MIRIDYMERPAAAAGSALQFSVQPGALEYAMVIAVVCRFRNTSGTKQRASLIWSDSNPQPASALFFYASSKFDFFNATDRTFDFCWMLDAEGTDLQRDNSASSMLRVDVTADEHSVALPRYWFNRTFTLECQFTDIDGTDIIGPARAAVAFGPLEELVRL